MSERDEAGDSERGFDEDAYLRWWEQTFGERQDEVERVFGRSHPPGSPEGYVIAFDWDDVRIPGGCCLAFPPRAPDVPWHHDWVYAGLGLTQPPSPEDVPSTREDAAARPGYDAEFGLVLAEPADWALWLIRQLMWYGRAKRPIGAGDRMPFGAERAPDGSIDANLGDQAADGVQLVGEMRALLFWPCLSAPRSTFTTATGPFTLLIGTAITAGEWELARRLSSEHLLLLLHRAGVGQRSDLHRRCLTTDPAAAAHLRQVEAMTRDTAARSLMALRDHELIPAWRRND